MNITTEFLSDPEIFQRLRLPAHSSHSFYKTREECDQDRSSLKKTLNGTWRFHYANNFAARPEGFQGAGFDVQGWDYIQVPGHIQMQGFEPPHYVNTMYPWDGHENIVPGEIPTVFNPVGSYVRNFTVPEAWKKQAVFVSFEGVESAFAVWINGMFAGYSEDTFTAADFEITQHLVEGANTIAVQCYKWCSGSWLEDQDFWRMSGIFREVSLYTKPEGHIDDIFIKTDVAQDHSVATLTLELAYQTAPHRIELKGLSGAEISLAEEQGHITATVENPSLWSAEFPNLYDITLEVYSSQALVEVIPLAVGFRTFAIENGLMCINGKRIVFNGVNRHEFSDTRGRAITKEDMLTDVLNMKRNNINAVRASHYPNHSYFYELCDRYGLYVIDEANLETHGSWMVLSQVVADEHTVPGDNPRWRNNVLDRAKSMLERNKNHPSILIWSSGNEAYGGENIFAMSEYFRATDPSRLVQYEGVFHDRRYNDTSDVESRMYPYVETDIVPFLEQHRDKPYIACEYSHSMGNSNGAMYKYTNLAKTEPLYQGGFIWDYIDQSIRTTDRLGRTFQAVGGDFGDRPSDYNFCVNGIVFADRTNTPKMQEVKYLYQNISLTVQDNTLTVINDSLFTNTDRYALRLTLLCDGTPIKEHFTSLSVAPGDTGSLALPFAPYGLPGEYAVVASFLLKENRPWAKKGHEVAFGQGILYTVTHPQKEQYPPLKIVDGDVNIGIKGERFEAMFSRQAGGLISYRYGGKEMLAHPPTLNFWRAPVDNDEGWDMPYHMPQWANAGRYAKMTELSLTEENNTACVRCRYDLAGVEGTATVSYTVFGDGEVAVEVAYHGPTVEVPEFSYLVKLSAEYSQLSWYGVGPEESPVDRQCGAQLGRFSSSVSQQMTRYARPQDCGNHVGTRWLQLSDEQGFGFAFAMDCLTFSALPYTPHEIESAWHPNELPPSHYTVLRIAGAQMGVGGDDTWGATPHKEHRAELSDGFQFSFRFCGA